MDYEDQYAVIECPATAMFSSVGRQQEEKHKASEREEGGEESDRAAFIGQRGWGWREGFWAGGGWGSSFMYSAVWQVLMAYS